MGHWWNAGELQAVRPRLRELILKDIGFSDFDLAVAESVLRLASQGKIEMGERNGHVVLREPTEVRYPDFGTWARHFFTRR